MNEQRQHELTQARDDSERFQEAMERILAVSKLALWDSLPRRAEEVGPDARRKDPERNN